MSFFRSPLFAKPGASAAPDKSSKSSSPANLFGSTSGEYGMFGGIARPKLNRHGAGVTYVNVVEDLCLGFVGASKNKFCCRTTCGTKSHRSPNKIAIEALVPGLYVQSGPAELFCSPVLEDQKISDEALEQLLAKPFDGAKEAIRYIGLFNQSDLSFLSDIDQIESLDQDVKVSAESKTPFKKRRTNVSSHYEEFINIVKESQEAEKEGNDPMSPSTMADEMTKMLRALINAVQEGDVGLGTVEGKVQELYLQVGNPPAMGLKFAPNLWTAYQNLLDELVSLRQKTASIPSSDEWVTPATMAHVETRLDNQAEALSDAMTAAFTNVGVAMDEIKGVSYDPATCKSLSQVSEMIDIIGTRISEFQRNLSTMTSNASRENTSVSFGGFTWNNHEELHAWAQTHLPADMPFGAFVDVYSFLERVVSFRDVASSAELKNMEVRKKLGLSADEALVLESFKHPLPKLFSGGASETAMAKSLVWLPGIPSPENWEDEYGTSGVRVIIKDNEEVIRNRLEAVNLEKLSKFDRASAMARQSVSDTITFVHAASRFISETHRRLDLAGFGKDNAWTLVSKLVHRIFAVDCHLKRGPVLEMLNATDTRVLSIGALWGTFATHQVMREYMKYGIENHPSIASEYVRFLVANCGLSKIASLETRCLKLESDVKELRTLVGNASKSATSAANKADEAKKLASTAKNIAEEAKKLAKK